MFDFFKRTPDNCESKTFNLKGMRCSSCAVNIDLALEDLEGINKTKTNYAKSKIEICFDPAIVKLGKIKKTISDLGYSIVD